MCQPVLTYETAHNQRTLSAGFNTVSIMKRLLGFVAFITNNVNITLASCVPAQVFLCACFFSPLSSACRRSWSLINVSQQTEEKLTVNLR